MNRLTGQIFSIVIAAMIVVALIFGLMLFAYIFLFAALIGCIIFLVQKIRDKFFSARKVKKSRQGRIIDSDDWKKL